MSMFPAGNTPQQPLAVFFVDSSGQSVTVSGTTVSSSTAGYPTGVTPQQSLPMLVVDPYTGAPLSLSTNGTAPNVFHAAVAPQQAIPIVLVDPASARPLSASSVIAILSALAGTYTRVFSPDFSQEFA